MQELTNEEIKKISLNVLKKVTDICEDLDLKYTLAYGTMIGAVRHKGFIPWDDDIDILMPRPDYEKLILYFKKNKRELAPFMLYHYTAKLRYPWLIARIGDTRYPVVSDYGKSYKMSAFIDIYPLDGVVPSSDGHCKQLEEYNPSKYYYPKYSRKMPKCGNKNILLKTLFLRYCPFSLYFGYKSIEKNAQKLKYCDCDFVACVTWPTYKQKEKFRKEWIEETIYVPFESYNFKMSKHYDEILRQIYGDYMKEPPLDEQIGHHFYRAFKEDD